MQIRGDFFKRILLNTGIPGGENLQLNQGDLVRGMVEALKEQGLIQINLRGISIEAQTEVEVQPGQQLYLYVDGVREGRIYLRVVSPEMKQSLEDRAIANNLVRIGLQGSHGAIEAARKLIHYNLPVTRENISLILKGASLLGEINSRYLEIAALVMARGAGTANLPRFFPAMRDFLSRPQNAARLLDEAALLLANLKAADNSGPAEGDGARRGEIIWDSGKPGRAVSAGTAEAGAKSLSGVNSPAAGLGRADSIAAPMGRGREISWLESLLKSLGDLLRVRVGDSSRTLAVQLQENPEKGLEVLRSLVLLQEFLQNHDELARHPVMKEVLERIQTAERELGGQSVWNLPGAGNLHPEFSGFFAIPLEVNGEECLCQLKIFRDKEHSNSWEEAEQVSLAVGLDTACMGRVLFYMVWRREGPLELQGVVEHQPVLSYLETNLSELVKGLETLGYSVVVRGIRLEKKGAGAMSLRPCLAEHQEFDRPLGIDIRV